MRWLTASNQAATILASGNIEAHQSVLGFKTVQSRIAELLFNEGQWVNAGTLISRLDDSDCRQQVAMAKASLEVIMVSPIRPAEFTLGKTVPYFVVGLGRARHYRGDLLVPNPVRRQSARLCVRDGALPFEPLGARLPISTACSTQQQVFATNFFVLNPFFILSGFSFPISSMPDVLQWLTYINPLRYFFIVIHGTVLKGIGVAILWPDLVAMAAIAAVLLTISILRFWKSLE